jgi:hypothetical protein
MPRRKIPLKIEAEVLTKCRRRCCLCYGIDGDLNEKQGQIAHLDQNSSNAAASNLVFLCLPHHDDYDTRRSQSKGYSSAEARIYREQLWEAIKLEKHLNERPGKPLRKRRNLSHSAKTSYDKLIKVSPNAAILRAWIDVEKAAIRKVNNIVMRNSEKSLETGMVIAILTRMGFVSESVSSDLHRLWHLRNQVAHGLPSSLTTAEAEEFCQRALVIISALSAP